MDIKSSVNLISDVTLMIINISFIGDIFCNFHTGLYRKGTIINDKTEIAK